MAFHVYDGRRVIYETLDDARSHAQAAIDECRKQATLYEWPEMVSEIAVYEAPDDCGEPWRDGVLVLEARERVVEDEDHPSGQYSEFDLVEVGSVSDPVPARERSSRLKVNISESYVGALSPTGGPGGTPELVDVIPLAEYLQSAAETVHVWSLDPAVIGTTVVVSTAPDADSFDVVVADLWPESDDGGEKPGAMCKRALAKAKARVDLIKQVAILVSGADDAEDFERTYGDEDRASIRATARDIIHLVRATPALDMDR